MPTRSITRPITSPIARAVDAACGAWNPRALFAAGEQGVIYDPSDLSTLWQDSAGTTPVTAAGQPVGLMLDKSKGVVLGSENISNGDFSGGTVGWAGYAAASISVVNTELEVVITGSSGGFADAQALNSVVAGRWYEFSFDVRLGTYSGAFDFFVNGVLCAAAITATQTKTRKTVRFLSPVLDPPLRVTRATAATGTSYFDNISVKELPGNHASQPTASAKPFARDAPRRIDYDADDSLVATFPSALGSACTVARSIPGVGAQILTAQTIGTTFTDNVDNCGLIIINRALNPTETANLTRFLNQRAGV